MAKNNMESIEDKILVSIIYKRMPNAITLLCPTGDEK